MLRSQFILDVQAQVFQQEEEAIFSVISLAHSMTDLLF